MFFKRIFAFILVICFIVSSLIIPASAIDSSAVFTVNSINDTRWENLLCVYRGIATTGQNEWGEDIIVNSDGIVIGKIPSGDMRGADLAVPNGGMVVSGTNNIGKTVYDAASIGDKCIFDESAMTVRFIKSGAEVFQVNSINDTRWENLLCVYRGVENTNQNKWGDNVIVDSNGIVIDKIPSGDERGANLAVPNGGMVVSGTNNIGKSVYDTAKIGNKCIFDEYSMAVCFLKVESKMFYVNSINGTRWADYICVYRGIESTGQNEWGYNVVVDGNGTVTDKIPAGDARGANLAIPENCIVVSGTGEIGKSVYNSVEVGDKCLFDDYGMRVYFAKGAIDPFYQKEIRVTGYNAERYANEVIVYNRSGENTKTNVFGYEVCVSADGYVISAGGNNNIVPQGGYVISATEAVDTEILKMYFTVGAKCTLNTNSVTAEYTEKELAKTAESELNNAKAKLQAAKSQYKLIDYTTLESKLAAISLSGISTIEQRNKVISQIRELDPLFVESRSVDTRAVWYTALETTAEQIKAVVAEMKAAGFNELVLSTDSASGTIIPIDTQKIPFKRNPVADNLDVLQTYIDECRANDMSIIVLTPVMSNTYAIQNTAWLDVTNTGEERSEKFLSPANSKYRKAYMDFLTYVITNYDVDGVQLDFIRYPQFYGGVDAGYDDATIALFKEKTGLGENVVREIGQQLTSHPKWNVWHNFKTELINSWVKDAYGLVRETCPELYITAAVAYSGLSSYCQNSADWLEGGYIDGVYVMSYVEEINEQTVTSHLNNRTDKSYLVMGCGAYLSISNKSLIEQTDNSDVYGADGTGYFEWGAVKSHGYTELLKNHLFKNDAIPFTSNVNAVVDRLVATAKERIALYCASANSDKAAKLEAIMAALPNKNADKNAIVTALNAISAEISGTEKEYLTADLNSALRALNMARSTQNPETPNEPENPSGPFPPKDNEDTDSGNNGGDNSGNNDGGNPVDPPKEEVIKGDVNASGEIDSMDYVLVKRAYFGTFNFNEEQLAIGDVNASGEIDSMDYVLIKRAYFGTFSFQ